MKRRKNRRVTVEDVSRGLVIALLVVAILGILMVAMAYIVFA